MVPAVAAHEALRPTGPGEFLRVAAEMAGWPLRAIGTGVFLVNLPAGVLAWRLLRERPGPEDIRWRFLAMMAWVGLECVAVALSRTHGHQHASRYLDIFALNPLINFGVLLHLLAGRNRPYLRWATAAWVLVITANLVTAARPLPRHIGAWHSWGLAHRQVLAAYLHSGDPAVFAGKTGPEELPYPKADRLVDTLAQPEIRGILPLELLPKPLQALRPGPALWGSTWPRPAIWVRRRLLRLPPLMIALAATILTIAALRPRPRRD